MLKGIHFTAILHRVFWIFLPKFFIFLYPYFAFLHELVVQTNILFFTRICFSMFSNFEKYLFHKNSTIGLKSNYCYVLWYLRRPLFRIIGICKYFLDRKKWYGYWVGPFWNHANFLFSKILTEIYERQTGRKNYVFSSLIKSWERHRDIKEHSNNIINFGEPKFTMTSYCLQNSGLTVHSQNIFPFSEKNWNTKKTYSKAFAYQSYRKVSKRPPL